MYSCSDIVIIVAMNDEESSITLSQDDVPGASLKGRDVGLLKIPELKRWLQCRRAPTKGLKADLVARCVFLLKYTYKVALINCFSCSQNNKFYAMHFTHTLCSLGLKPILTMGGLLKCTMQMYH